MSDNRWELISYCIVGAIAIWIVSYVVFSDSPIMFQDIDVSLFLIFTASIVLGWSARVYSSRHGPRLWMWWNIIESFPSIITGKNLPEKWCVYCLSTIEDCHWKCQEKIRDRLIELDRLPKEDGFMGWKIPNIREGLNFETGKWSEIAPDVKNMTRIARLGTFAWSALEYWFNGTIDPWDNFTIESDGKSEPDGVAKEDPTHIYEVKSITNKITFAKSGDVGGGRSIPPDAENEQIFRAFDKWIFVDRNRFYPDNYRSTENLPYYIIPGAALAAVCSEVFPVLKEKTITTEAPSDAAPRTRRSWRIGTGSTRNYAQTLLLIHRAQQWAKENYDKSHS